MAAATRAKQASKRKAIDTKALIAQERCLCGEKYNDYFMVCCDKCEIWVHGECAHLDAVSAAAIDKYHCRECEKVHGPSIAVGAKKPPKREAVSNYPGYYSMKVGKGFGKNIQAILRKRSFDSYVFPEVSAEDFTIDYVRKHGFDEPLMFEKGAELGMKMPASKISVRQIARLVGDREIDIMDVATQEALEGWKMNDWATYFGSKAERKQILNVISLEISDTPLGEEIKRPRIVEELDWIERFWPRDVPGHPKVQLYCLMSPSGCWTDFHVDFGGTSVFYHLLSGKKQFFMIPPTTENLSLYTKWCKCQEQGEIFLADFVPTCFQINVLPGQTLFIPSGWIHGVYTPEDSIVIGGNFVHSYSVSTQLKIYKIEDQCDVPQMFRFPSYEKLCWYAAEETNRLLNEKPNALSDEEVREALALADFLYHQTLRISQSFKRFKLYENDQETRRFIRESIPSHLKNDALNFVKQFAQKLCDRALKRASRTAPKRRRESEVQNETPNKIIKVSEELPLQ